MLGYDFSLAMSLKCLPTSQLTLLVASGDPTETQDAGFCTSVFLKFSADHLHMYLHPWLVELTSQWE